MATGVFIPFLVLKKERTTIFRKKHGASLATVYCGNMGYKHIIQNMHRRKRIATAALHIPADENEHMMGVLAEKHDRALTR